MSTKELNKAVFLEDIAKKCNKFFKRNALFPPTIDILSKLVTKLFQSQSNRYIKRFTVNGIRKTAYINLVEITPSDDFEPLSLPEYCTKSYNEQSHLTVCCPREETVNGKPVVLSATFAITHLVLTVHGWETFVKVPVPVTQFTLQGVISLLSKLVICKGSQLNFDLQVATVQGQISETWGSILDITQKEERVRCKTCITILSFNSKADCCEACREAKDYVRRKCSNIPQPVANDCPPNDGAMGESLGQLNSDNNQDKSVVDTDSHHEQSKSNLRSKGTTKKVSRYFYVS